MVLLPFCMSIGSLVCMPFCQSGQQIWQQPPDRDGLRCGHAFHIICLSCPSVYLLYPLCMIYGAVASIYDIAINGNSILVENSYKRAISASFMPSIMGTSLGALFSILFISFHVSLPVHFRACIFVFVSFRWSVPFLLKERPKRQAAAEPSICCFQKVCCCCWFLWRCSAE